MIVILSIKFFKKKKKIIIWIKDLKIFEEVFTKTKTSLLRYNTFIYTKILSLLFQLPQYTFSKPQKSNLNLIPK